MLRLSIGWMPPLTASTGSRIDPGHQCLIYMAFHCIFRKGLETSDEDGEGTLHNHQSIHMRSVAVELSSHSELPRLFLRRDAPAPWKGHGRTPPAPT